MHLSTSIVIPHQCSAILYGSLPSAAAAAPTHYDRLGVPRGCDKAAVAKAYRTAALQWHPDKWAAKPAAQRLEAEERFKQINHAYCVLSDPAQRRDYDATL